MFKQILTLLLATFYLTLSSGVGIYSHFCRGELLSASVFADTGKKCICGIWAESQGASADCCHDEFAFVKLSQPHADPACQALPLPSTLAAPLLPEVFSPFLETGLNSVRTGIYTDPPPTLSRVILYRRLVFYA